VSKALSIDRVSYWDHPGESQSKLKDLDPPALYFAKHVAKTVPQDDTAALRQGRALHALTFEPDDFAHRFPIFVGEKRSNDDKARFADMDQRAARLDGCVLREKDADDVRGMANALRSDKYAAGLLAKVDRAEFPIEWECSTTGLLCKARIDALAMGGDVAIDLKSTTNGEAKMFAKAIHSYGYSIQAAHYLAGIEATTGKRPAHYLLLVVESSAPYLVAHYRLGQRSIEKGERERLRLLDLLAECRATNAWPSYTQGFQEIDEPEWAL
jgi:hypothetical protein